MRHNIEDLRVILVELNYSFVVLTEVGLLFNQSGELLVEQFHGLSFYVDLVDVRNFIEVVLNQI